MQLLWDRGVLHELKIVAQIGDYVELSRGSLKDRCEQTLTVMKNGAQQIYQGVLVHENLLGIPDILRRTEDSSYIPVEIKSGSSVDGEDDSGSKGTLKKTYAVQLALYAELLQKLGVSPQRRGAVIDISATEVAYNLDQQMGPRRPKPIGSSTKKLRIKLSSCLLARRSTRPICAATARYAHGTTAV